MRRVICPSNWLRTITIGTAALLALTTAAPAYAQADDAAKTPPGPLARVHLDAGKGVLLLQDTPSGATVEICEAPCDAQLPTKGHYRVSGGGSGMSDSFTLRAPAGTAETLSVDGSARTLAAAGAIAIFTGTVLLLAWIGIGLLSDNGISDTANFVCLGGGIPGVLGGLILLVGNAHGKDQVQQKLVASPVAAPAWAQPLVSAQGTAWRSASPSFGVPLLSGQF
jgi:hypothetical protein